MIVNTALSILSKCFLFIGLQMKNMSAHIKIPEIFEALKKPVEVTGRNVFSLYALNFCSSFLLFGTSSFVTWLYAAHTTSQRDHCISFLLYVFRSGFYWTISFLTAKAVAYSLCIHRSQHRCCINCFERMSYPRTWNRCEHRENFL